jgi:gluconolactonase
MIGSPRTEAIWPVTLARGDAATRQRARASTVAGLWLVAAAWGALAAHAQDGEAALSIERLDPRLDALIPRDAVVEAIADGLTWAEGPVWDGRAGSLLVSDVPKNRVLSWREGGALEIALEPSGYTGAAPFVGREPGSNGLAFDRDGRLVLCQHGDRAVARREADGRFTVLAQRYQGRRLNSPNDLVFRSNGDLYFTDPPYGLPDTFEDPAKELSFQGVFRLTAGGELEAVVTDLSSPNGLAFSPDERTLYVANSSPEQPVWMAYPLRPDGTLAPGRVFAEARAFVVDRERYPGLPDGLKVDRAGNLFATGPGGVHVYAPDGARLGRIVTGVPTGNVAWGGDGSVLYIAANQRILRIRTTTQGHPAPR